MKTATAKARYIDKVLKPLGGLDRKDGDEVELKVRGSATSRIFGIVKCWERLEEAHDHFCNALLISLCCIEHSARTRARSSSRTGLLM